MIKYNGQEVGYSNGVFESTDFSMVTARPEFVLKGKKFYDEAGQIREGVASLTVGDAAEAVLEEKTITANGEYTPRAGVDGFSKVTVNVEAEQGEYYDEFWDNLQNYGNPTTYAGAFGAWCTKKMFQPKYKTLKFSAAYAASSDVFVRCGTATEPLDLSDIVFDFSEITEIASLFNNANAKNIYLDFTGISTAHNVFNQSNGGYNGIENVTLKITEELKNIANIFNYCMEMQNCHCTADSVIAAGGIDLSTCNNLTKESIMSFINALKDYSASPSSNYYINLGSDNIKKLTSEELGIIKAKGWTYDEPETITFTVFFNKNGVGHGGMQAINGWTWQDVVNNPSFVGYDKFSIVDGVVYDNYVYYGGKLRLVGVEVLATDAVVGGATYRTYSEMITITLLDETVSVPSGMTWAAFVQTEIYNPYNPTKEGTQLAADGNHVKIGGGEHVFLNGAPVLLTDSFVSGAVYTEGVISGGDTITFTTPYDTMTVPKGTTWQQIIDNYNPAPSGNYFAAGDSGVVRIVASDNLHYNGNPVYVTDTVIDGASYGWQ